MTPFDSKVLPGSQKMRTHVAMVFAWNEPTDIFLLHRVFAFVLPIPVLIRSVAVSLR